MKMNNRGMSNGSGVGVLDKAFLILTALETGPTTLAGLVHVTGLPRPTAHRLAGALEFHRLITRDDCGRYLLGPRLAELAAAYGGDKFVSIAGPILARLRDISGESVHACRRQGDQLVCVATAERPAGLRDSVPVGATLPLDSGSAGLIIQAWERRNHEATKATLLTRVRHSGFAESMDSDQLVSSVSAPVLSPSGEVMGTITLSGPVGRLTPHPGRVHAPAVMAAANLISERLRRAASVRPAEQAQAHAQAANG